MYVIFIVTAAMLDVLQNHESIDNLRMNQFNFGSISPVISGNIFEKSLQQTDGWTTTNDYKSSHDHLDQLTASIKF